MARCNLFVLKVPLNTNQPTTILLAVVSGSAKCYCMSPSCVPNLKLLSLTVVEISGSPKIFGVPPCPDPTNFGPKSCFWQHYYVTPSCIPNLKSLASVVAEISWGSRNIWRCSLAPTPANFGSRSCL